MSDATVRIPKSEYDDLLRIKELAVARGVVGTSQSATRGGIKWDAIPEEDAEYQPAFLRRVERAAAEIVAGDVRTIHSIDDL